MPSSTTNQVDAQVLNRFELKKRLGKGSYGVVWKAFDRKKNETVALKKIFDAFRNQTDAQRTFREVCFLNYLRQHPNIIKLHTVIKASNNQDLYLTFEFMEADLHNIIRKGCILKSAHKQFIMYQLFNAVLFLHSGQIIHRDLKPSNVLIDSDCNVKICDFGLARSLSPASAVGKGDTCLQLTEYVATRWYRAPEILLGHHQYTKAADIWSLGCILAEMLMGKALFPGVSTTNQLERIVSAIPVPEKHEIKHILKSDFRLNILEQAKESKMAKKSLREILPISTDAFAFDLITRLIVFRFDQRLTIEDCIAHGYVKKFRKPAHEVVLSKAIIPPVDDNVMLSVTDYRSLLYEMIYTKKLNPALVQLPSQEEVTEKKLESNMTDLNNNINNQQEQPKVMRREWVRHSALGTRIGGTRSYTNFSNPKVAPNMTSSHVWDWYKIRHRHVTVENYKASVKSNESSTISANYKVGVAVFIRLLDTLRN
ncbi:hypothetical protein Ciccas_002297 [Cichlidogyrus casuarinus]|uniref:Mitogen-activated protein kinase n=1 Tax=Cichlidogyrus casuarinus TaxID=1844966 RepID=A0ABD2QI95_9PLAT